jgi:CheY-like chemotaxis protein
MSRILVVDEDPKGRRSSAAILRDLRCRVALAPDARAGLDALHRGGFDAVLVSASLPEMSAPDFVDALHHDQAACDTPVLVVSVTPRASVDAIRAGARGCLRDPIDTASVVSALSPLLPKRRR